MTHFIESIGPSLVTANAVLDGFSIILQFDTLLYIGLGMLVGMLVGAFPGVTATMAVALAAGFTMTMEPMQGLSVLLKIGRASCREECRSGGWAYTAKKKMSIER